MLNTQTQMPVTMKLKRSARIPVLALSVLVALAIAVALPGSRVSPSVPTAHAAAQRYYPLIQYRGTGAGPIRSASPNTSRYIRAEHSYGAVP